MLNMKPKAQKQGWYSLAVNKSTKHADLYLYGVIGGYYVNIQSFLADLRNAGNVDTITVYLNTFGGTFYDGLPIFNTLKQHPAQVTVKVMGYALSMGSVIMLAADTVEMAENALVMIHRAQGGAWGDAKELRKMATVLEKHEAAIIPSYLHRMSISEAELQTLLQDETWYTAAEAKAAGLIDTITDKIDLSQAEADLTEDAWAFAAENFNHPPANFVSRLDAQLSRNVPLFQRLLNKVVGHPLPNLNANTGLATEIEDDDMKPEDIEAVAAAVMTQLDAREAAKAKAQAENRATSEASAELVAAKQEIAELKAKLTTVETERDNVKRQVADLSTPSGSTKVPENTGPSGDRPKHFS